MMRHKIKKNIALSSIMLLLGSVILDPFVASENVYADDTESDTYTSSENLQSGLEFEEVKISDEEAEELFVEQSVNLFGEEAVIEVAEEAGTEEEEQVEETEQTDEVEEADSEEVISQTYGTPASSDVDLDNLTDEQEDAIIENLYENHASDSSVYAKYSSDVVYNHLTSAQKSVYDQLYTACIKYLTDNNQNMKSSPNGYYVTALSNGSLTRSQAASVGMLFDVTNPQFYFLKAAYSVDTNSVTLYVSNEFGIGSTRAVYTEKMFSAVDNVVNSINSSLSQRNKAQAVHDWICKKVAYDPEVKAGKSPSESEPSKYNQSAYGVFTEDYTVCAGYSEAFELLCNALGIETIAVTSEGHEWNEICIDDTWYIVDVTWDDLDYGSPGYTYNFFCVTADDVRRLDQLCVIYGGNYSYTQEKYISTHYAYAHEIEYLWSYFTIPIQTISVTPASYNASPGSSSSSSTTPASTSTPTVTTNAMYRVYNPNSGEHFYTASVGEKNHLVSVGWRYEGIAWNAPTSGSPVYRLYNPNAGDHHYTVSLAEKNMLVRVGWRYEGIGWYSGGGTPLYRAYNPNAKAGSHHYTTSYGEIQHIVSVGWRYEGIAWYGN